MYVSRASKIHTMSKMNVLCKVIYINVDLSVGCNQMSPLGCSCEIHKLAFGINFAGTGMRAAILNPKYIIRIHRTAKYDNMTICDM